VTDPLRYQLLDVLKCQQNGNDSSRMRGALLSTCNAKPQPDAKFLHTRGVTNKRDKRRGTSYRVGRWGYVGFTLSRKRGQGKF
jgi:hypothetical protein